jgi:creatinine amidohydrolase
MFVQRFEDSMPSLSLEDMTWPDVAEALRQGVRTILIMVCSTEQHGPHLPLCTDSVIGKKLGEELARRLGNALLAPVISIGCSDYHMNFPGTITLRKETLTHILIDYCLSICRHGFTNIVLIPIHGGNYTPVAEVAQHLGKELEDVRIIAPTDLTAILQMVDSTARSIGIDPRAAGAHAGELETSLMMILKAELVKAECRPQGFLGDLATSFPLAMEKGIEVLSTEGVLGDPRAANLSNGRVYFEAFVRFYLEFIREQISR